MVDGESKFDPALHYKIAVVKMAYHLASDYTGPGSGPTTPEFWLTQYLGEDYDKTILGLWHPKTHVPLVTQTCVMCESEFQAPADIASKTITVSTKPVCPRCEPSAHNS